MGKTLIQCINEALGKEKNRVSKTDDEMKRELDLQIARIDNDVSDFFEYQVECIKKYFPELKQVNSKSGFFDKTKEPAYYINDNGDILLRFNLNKKFAKSLVNMINSCDIKIESICGDFNIENVPFFRFFPKDFPSVLIGDLVISENVKSLNNAPKYVDGDVYIVNSNRYINNDELKEYENIIEKSIIRMNITTPSRNVSFSMKDINESVSNRNFLELFEIKI